MLGSLGFPELLFIFFLALLIFGPRKLPEIGRTIGRGLAEFRKASTDLKRSLNAEMIEEEIRQSDPRKLLRNEPITGPKDSSPVSTDSVPADPVSTDPVSTDPAPATESAENASRAPRASGTISRGSLAEAGNEDSPAPTDSQNELPAESPAQ